MHPHPQAGTRAHLHPREEVVHGYRVVAGRAAGALGGAYRPARRVRHPIEGDPRMTDTTRSAADTTHPELDLTVSRIIRAPRAAVWSAWTTPASFEQWWVPAPARARVERMELH